MSDRCFYTKERGGFIEKWLLCESQNKKKALDSERTEVFAKEGIFDSNPSHEKFFTLKTYIYSSSTQAGILYIDAINIAEFNLNGRRVKVNFANSLLMHASEFLDRRLMAHDFSIVLKAGWNTLTVSCESNKEEWEKYLAQIKLLGSDGLLMKNIVFSTEKNDSVSHLSPVKKIILPEKDKIVMNLADAFVPEVETSMKKASVKGFRLGTGKKNPAFGRFGFNKGDGLLDCGMPYLGAIDKMYLFGTPAFGKFSRWMINMVPPGIQPSQRWKGNMGRKMIGWDMEEFGFEKSDTIEVKWLSVKWGAKYHATEPFYERKKNASINFSCTYSLGTPGILLETNDPALSLKGLLTVSGFKNLLLPLEKGITLRDTTGGGIVYDREKDGNLTDNWILMWGADTFPDIPLLIIPQKKPKEIIYIRNCDGTLDRVDIHSPPTIGSAIVMTPFGIESFTPEEAAGTEWIARAIKNATFWSKAVLAFPEDCEEYYQTDKKNEKIDILEQFSYKFIKDEWGSKAIVTAPLPPPLSLLEDKSYVKLPENIKDFEFPTKYGYLKGVLGKTYNKYSIPIPPMNRKFPFKNTNDTEVIEDVNEEMQAYFDFHDKFPGGKNLYSFCTPACFLGKYAHPLALFNFLKPEYRKTIEEKAKKNIEYACNFRTRYKYTKCDYNHLLYDAPEPDEVIEFYKNLKPIRECRAWYKRREPFTGLEYLICYINIFVINNHMKTGSMREVYNYKPALIENDWGVGLTLYGIYLTALLTGKWESVKKNWNTLKKGFHYFHVLHDWACMGSAYAENGRSWVEGANYGAFVGMTQMAKLLGDENEYAHALYLSSKNAFLRMAIFISSQIYFYKYFRCEPYWTQKYFHDEAYIGNAFMNAQIGVAKNGGGLYNWTTEGLYPEVFMLHQKYLPEYFYQFRDKLLAKYPDWRDKKDVKVHWHGSKNGDLSLQIVYSLFMMCAMDKNYDKDLLLKQIEEAAKNGRFPLNWYSLHAPDTRIPKNTLKSYVKILAMSREHLAWIEEWQNVKIISAEYDKKKDEAVINFEGGKNGKLVLGITMEPTDIANDNILLRRSRKLKKGTYVINGKNLEVLLIGSGLLRINFNLTAKK